jgi:hypothetical protein
MTFMSSQWIWRADEVPGDVTPITIDRVCGFHGVKYAIRQAGACMDANGEWEFEPMPSSRSDEWLKRFRFKEWKAAADAITRHCRHPWGRFAQYAKQPAQRKETP